MPKHLLPCQCGEQMAIDVGQAGQLLNCPCGLTVEAPGMRDIRALPTAENDVTERPETKQAWSQVQGLLFSAGLIILVGSLAGLGYCGYSYSQLDLSYDERTDVELKQASVETASLEALHAEWKIARDFGLVPVATPQHIRNQKTASRLTRYMVGTGLGALAGLICIVIACRPPAALVNASSN